MLTVAVLCFCAKLVCASLTPGESYLHHGEGAGKPLAMAFAKPPNVATNLDCAIKELAWDYAKKIMNTVSVYSWLVIL